MVNFNMKDILAFCGINSKTSGKLLHMGGGGGATGETVSDHPPPLPLLKCLGKLHYYFI